MSGTSCSFQVRPALAGDREAFTSLRIELFRETGGIRSEDQADALAQATREAFTEGLRARTCLAWLAFTRRPAGDAEAVGSAAMLVWSRLPSPQNPDAVEGYLAHLFTRPAWRRQGVGMALMEAALDEARRLRLRRIRLHATADGRALYERLGFKLSTNNMELYL